eukprot:3762574-Amphidinium_carterae.1
MSESLQSFGDALAEKISVGMNNRIASVEEKMDVRLTAMETKVNQVATTSLSEERVRAIARELTPPRSEIPPPGVSATTTTKPHRSSMATADEYKLIVGGFPADTGRDEVIQQINDLISDIDASITPCVRK